MQKMNRLLNTLQSSIAASLLLIGLAFGIVAVQSGDVSARTPRATQQDTATTNTQTGSGGTGGGAGTGGPAAEAEKALGKIGGANNNIKLEAAITQIIKVILFIVGILAVIMIIFGGIQYLLSAGDTSKTEKAKNTILYAVVGLVVAILAYALVTWVVSAIGGSGGASGGSDSGGTTTTNTAEGTRIERGN